MSSGQKSAGREFPGHKTIPLALLVALQGAISGASLVVEIVAGRMLAPYVGMSVYTWTSIIAVVLGGFSVGHWLGGRIAEKPADRALALTGWLILAAALTTAIAVQLLYALAVPVMAAGLGAVWTIVLLSAGVFFLPSLFAGIPAPVLSHVAVSSAKNGSGRALGAMFAAGAIGAIGGTLLSGFVFIPWLGTAVTLAIVTAAYGMAAVILFWLSKQAMRGNVALSALALVTLGLAIHSATRPSPCTEESQYYCIRVFDVSQEAGQPVNLMVLDHLSHGTSARDQPRVMHTEFTAMLDGIARRRMGEKEFASFFIGGGTYSVPRAWRDYGTGPITVAEIDPAVTRVAQEHFWFDSDGVEIVHEDARRALLSRSGKSYDVIVGDAFGDIAVPQHLVTREFFELVRARLSEDGVFVMNVIDFVEQLDALAAIHRTLDSVFPSVEVWTEKTPPQPGQQRVFVLAAGKSPSGFDAFTAAAPEPKRFAALGWSFTDRVLKARNSFVLTDDFAPIDRLLAPR